MPERYLILTESELRAATCALCRNGAQLVRGTHDPFGCAAEVILANIPRRKAVVCSTCGGRGFVELRVDECTCGGTDIGVGTMHEPGCGTEGHTCPDCQDGVRYVEGEST